MIARRSISRHRCSPAFSLGESLFAMTLVSFVLLAMIGVLPAGLGTLNSAAQRAAEARICQTMLADFEGRTWKSMEVQSETITFFDDQGVAYHSSSQDSTRGPTKTPVYAARAMLVVNPGNGEVAMAGLGRLPGENTPSPFLRYVRIGITSRAQDNNVVNQMQSAIRQGRAIPHVRLFTFVLANLEPEKGVDE